MSVRNQNVMLNAYYDFNTGTKFTPYVGGGIGLAHLKASSKFAGTDGADYAAGKLRNPAIILPGIWLPASVMKSTAI